MEHFIDANGLPVKLSFTANSLSKKAKHVLVICTYEDGWLLTKHKERGLEFPGGKQENGETLEAAAHREVKEETGATLKELKFIGEYEVGEGEDSFVKAIFHGDVEKVVEQNSYLETEGPAIINGDILEERLSSKFSFIMKDKVIEKSIMYLLNNKH